MAPRTPLRRSSPRSIDDPRDRRVVPAISLQRFHRPRVGYLPRVVRWCPAVMLHDAPRADLAATAREVLDGLRAWYGVGHRRLGP